PQIGWFYEHQLEIETGLSIYRNVRLTHKSLVPLRIAGLGQHAATIGSERSPKRRNRRPRY
ncbi:MAG: hypothetical protein WBW82_03690, partial [Candidatus Sulfotelmatobacter sp.]